MLTLCKLRCNLYIPSTWCCGRTLKIRGKEIHMKLQVGQRSKSNLAQKDGLALVRFVAFGIVKPSQIVFRHSCLGCNASVDIKLSETDDGKIWLEGPDYCSRCGARLTPQEPKAKKLTQRQISNYFG